MGARAAWLGIVKEVPQVSGAVLADDQRCVGGDLPKKSLCLRRRSRWEACRHLPLPPPRRMNEDRQRADVAFSHALFRLLCVPLLREPGDEAPLEALGV